MPAASIRVESSGLSAPPACYVVRTGTLQPMGNRGRQQLLRLLVALAMVATACGGSSGDGWDSTRVDSTGTTVTTTETSRPENWQQARNEQQGITTTTEPEMTNGEGSAADGSGDESTTTTTTGGDAATTTTTASGSSGVPGGSVGSFGVVGCSNTAMAVEGYQTVSELDLLQDGGATAGSVGRWGNPGHATYARYWGYYDELRPPTGYEGTWVQICLRFTEHEGTLLDGHKEWIEHIVGQIHSRDPGIPIWISGVNTFAEDFVCGSVGEGGVELAAEAAAWAAGSLSGVSLGPRLGPLSAAQILPDGTCHPNELGRVVLGEQLVAFFD